MLTLKHHQDIAILLSSARGWLQQVPALHAEPRGQLTWKLDLVVWLVWVKQQLQLVMTMLVRFWNAPCKLRICWTVLVDYLSIWTPDQYRYLPASLCCSGYYLTFRPAVPLMTKAWCWHLNAELLFLPDFLTTSQSQMNMIMTSFSGCRPGSSNTSTACSGAPLTVSRC